MECDRSPRYAGSAHVTLAVTKLAAPAETISREAAITIMTRRSAYAEFAEREKGTLAPGMLADLAVRSQDVYTVPPPMLPATTSVLTVVGSRIIHDELPSARPAGARGR